jgi:hypothetical protein
MGPSHMLITALYGTVHRGMELFKFENTVTGTVRSRNDHFKTQIRSSRIVIWMIQPSCCVDSKKELMSVV